jgi:hypothetical protein
MVSIPNSGFDSPIGCTFEFSLEHEIRIKEKRIIYFIKFIDNNSINLINISKLLIIKLVIMKKITLITFLIISLTTCYSQDSGNVMAKLKSVKELFDMDLITKEQYDSISNKLKDLILSQKTDSNNSIIKSANNNDENNLNLSKTLESDSKPRFSFDKQYSNEFIYQGRMIKEKGYGGVLVSSSLREIRRSDGKYFIFDISISNDSNKTINFTTNNISAVIYAKNGKRLKIKALTRKQYMKIKQRRQNLRAGLMAFSAGLNAASAGYSNSQTNSYGSASYSGSSNSNTNIYGSTSGYLGRFETNTTSSGNIYGSSSSYTTSYDGAAAYAASQNEQAKMNAFISASNEAKRRWNEEYLRNHTLTQQESISGLLNVKYYRAVRVDLIVTTNGYDYVFEWDPNDVEN